MEISSLDRMLIESIADLDAATNRIWHIQKKVAEAIDEVKDEWTKDSWVAGEEKFEESGDCRVALRSWMSEGDEWDAWFWLDDRHGDPDAEQLGTDSFWLTRLCGEGVGRMGFRFEQKKFAKTAWKKFLREKKNVDLLSDTQFVLDDRPSIFLPFQIDKASLAAAVEDEDYASCLQPMRNALDHISVHISKFNKLLTEMGGRSGDAPIQRPRKSENEAIASRSPVPPRGGPRR